MKVTRAVSVVFLSLLTWSASSSFSDTCENAELIVRGAKIITMDSSDRHRGKPMAVRNGRSWLWGPTRRWMPAREKRPETGDPSKTVLRA